MPFASSWIRPVLLGAWLAASCACVASAQSPAAAPSPAANAEPGAVDGAAAMDPADALRARVQSAIGGKDWAQVDALAAQAETIDGASATARGALWLQVGKARLAQAKFKEAEADLSRAMDAYGDRDHDGAFEALQMLGVARAQQGRLPDALEAFARAEELGRRLGKPDDPTFLSRFSGLHIYMGDWPKAVSYAERALAAWERDPQAMANPTAIYNNLGTAWNGSKEYEKAYQWFSKSYEYSLAHGLPASTAINNLGTVLREWGRDREALAKFEEFERIAIAANDRQGMAVGAKNIGETLIKLGDRVAAAAKLQRAYDIYVETDQRPKRLELYPVMIDNLDALGRTRDALRLMREWKSLNDEVVNVDSKERIANLESAIDLERKDRQLAAAERETVRREADLAALTAQQERERFVGYGLLLALALLAGFVVLLVRDRRFKARARRDLEALNRIVRRQSQEDALTGLRNRRYLAELMDGQRRRAQDERDAGPTESALFILIDLDHFKEINDRHGHAAGDAVLVEFAAVLRECQRAGDVLVRWGGEEFLWLCPDTPASAGPVLCERVRSTLRARNIVVDGAAIPLTASFGFAPHPQWPGRRGDWQLAMRIADAALYESKSGGRDRWTGYDSGTPPDAGVSPRDDIAALVAAGRLRPVPH